MEKLEATGAFDDVIPAAQDRTEAGLHRVTHRERSTPGVDGRSRRPRRRRPQAPDREAAGSRREAPVTPARRVLREKRPLIWPLAIALIAECRAVRHRRLSAVEEGRRRRAGGRGVCRGAPGRPARLRRGAGHDRRQGRRRTPSCRSSTATSCRPTSAARDGSRSCAIEQLAAQCDLRLERADVGPGRRCATASSSSSPTRRRSRASTATSGGSSTRSKRRPEFLVLENVELSQDEQENKRAERHRCRSPRITGPEANGAN